MPIRKATAADTDAIAAIYQKIHAAADAFTGWIDGVYPTRDTVLAALARDDLFVLEEDSRIVGSAILNQLQMDSYAQGQWQHLCNADQVMVMHTLTIDPDCAGHGYGTAFVHYYEQYAAGQGCTVLRMDTQEKNLPARALYRRLGFTEVGIVLCVFNGIPDVRLVLLEKAVSTSGR